MMMLAACDGDGAGNGGILRLASWQLIWQGVHASTRACVCVGRGLATAKISTSVCTFLWECRGLLFRLNMKNNETLFALLSRSVLDKSWAPSCLLALFPILLLTLLRFFRFTFAHNLTAGATMKRFRSHYVYDTLWLPQSHDRQAGRQAGNVLQHVRCFRVCAPPKTACHKVIYEKVLPPFWSFFFLVKIFNFSKQFASF